MNSFSLRKTSSKKVLWIILVLFLSGCGNSKKPGSDDDSSILPENPKEGVVQSESFYVRLYDEGKFPYYMSKTGDFGSKCEVVASASSSNIDCILDMNELDLYYHGAKLQYNVPASMCDYLEFKTYWYYNYEVGYGPDNVSLSVVKDDLGNILSATCSFDSVAGCQATEASYDAVKDKITCKYDNTDAEGPNCCMGTYTKTMTTTTGTGAPTTAVTTEKWGGNYKGCIGGAGKTNWELYSRDNLPMSLIQFTKDDGANKVYTISGPISTTNSGSTFPIANFYTAAKHTHNGYSSGTSSYPYIVVPIDDRNGSKLVSGNPYYQWRCMDKNREVKHQIRVSIREWNTYSEFLTFGTSKGLSGNPDKTGIEGVDCDYNNQNTTDNCEDLTDLDLISDLLSGVYNATTKPSYFPKELY